MEHKCKKTDLKTVEKCELNREEIIKALECCGTSDKSCSYCPLAKDYSPCSKTMADNALSLIKELTAENKLLNVELGNANSEILRLIEEKKELTRKLECAELQIEVKERICESYMLQYGTVADKEVFLKKERADTVRKYREQLHRAFAHSDSKDKFNKGFFLEMVDLIAKEIIGEGNG